MISIVMGCGGHSSTRVLNLSQKCTYCISNKPFVSHIIGGPFSLFSRQTCLLQVAHLTDPHPR
jgi:hypothetical protein